MEKESMEENKKNGNNNEENKINNEKKEEENLGNTKEDKIKKLNDYDSRYLEMLEEI